MLQGSQSEPDKRSLVKLLIICVFSAVLIVILLLFEFNKAVSMQPPIPIEQNNEFLALSSFQENTFFAISKTFSWQSEELISKITVIVTAYSSTVCQTDNTPFITAANTNVRSGIVAANFLPFGTRIKMPELYGNQIFVVEDRMHPRKSYQIDIWFPSYWQAKNFGVKNTYVEILES